MKIVGAGKTNAAGSAGNEYALGHIVNSVGLKIWLLSTKATKSTKKDDLISPPRACRVCLGFPSSYAVRSLVIYKNFADRQTFQVFTGAAPGGSSTSAIHGSRKTWKV
jgi:hypothetical protein